MPAAPFATFCGLVLALVFALVAPATAHADTYSLPRVNIQAQVMENGDLNVTEERTFAFEDTVNGVYWSIPFAQNEQGQTSSVTVSSVYEYDGSVGEGAEADARRASQPMQEVTSAEPGDQHVYTVENVGNALELKVFVPSEDGDEVTCGFRTRSRARDGVARHRGALLAVHRSRVGGGCRGRRVERDVRGGF